MPEKFEDIEIVEDERLPDPCEYFADIPARLISGVLGLMGFVLACVVGLLAENSGFVILTRALVAMVVCTLVGRVLGIAGEVCVREYVSRYKTDRPRPRKPHQLIELEQAKMAHKRMVDDMKKAA